MSRLYSELLKSWPGDCFKGWMRQWVPCDERRVKAVSSIVQR